MYTEQEQAAIAQTIIKQIGNRAFMMIGTKNIVYGTEGKWVFIRFNVMKNPEKIKYIKVFYDSGKDLYDLEYLDKNGKKLDGDEGFYGDQLRQAIGHHTRLAVSL